MIKIKPKQMKIWHYATVALVALISSIITQLYFKQEIRLLRVQMAEQSQQLKNAQHALEASRLEIYKATESASRDRQTKAVFANNAEIEDALDIWIGKVKRLSSYLQLNPGRYIPQMDLLTMEEWLDATKDGELKTDADLRKALAKLRGAARLKVAASIGDAWKAALAANGGEFPADTSRLAPYLPSGFNQSILTQLQLNTTGDIAGLRTAQKFYLIDKSVDLWDATLFYSQDGHWGSKSPELAEDRLVREAINRYTAKTGQAPTSLDQLLQQNLISAQNIARMQEVFTALNKKFAD